MADEFQLGSGNWWDSTRNRFDSGSSPPSSSSAALSGVGSFGWPTEIVDLKARSSMDSVSVSGSSMVDSGAGSGGVLADPDLQIMGLRLSSPAMDWNQTSLHGGKAESSFRSVLQETVMGSSSQDQWRQKIYSGNSEDSSGNEYKQIARGFSLDQPQFSSHISSGDSAVTCQGLATSTFQRDQAAYGSPSTIIQGLLGPDHSHQQQSSFDNRPINYPFPPSYGMNSGELSPSWSKFPQFLRTSPPKQQLPNQLQFSNNTPFWNATAASMNDARSSFFPSLQPQFPPPTFDEKPKVRDLVEKKSISETSNKRSRNETSSPLPAFKVRKEKMGDRVTALQQLVSPFGKTDTASVLSEAIDYIKFLHEQVNVLSSPYMKIGASMQHHQNSDKSKDPEGPKQDLRSRGLCLVPVSSTFPVTHETTVDFWTPTFGGTFR